MLDSGSRAPQILKRDVMLLKLTEVINPKGPAKFFRICSVASMARNDLFTKLNHAVKFEV